MRADLMSTPVDLISPSLAERARPGDAPTIDSRTVEIELTGGYVTFVDAEDWDKVCEMVGERRWHVFRGAHGNVYARCNANREGVCRTPLLHRLIMGAPRGMEVDHRDGDGLNNRRSNLRLATVGQNHRNRHKPYGTSKYLGVSATESGRWRAQIRTGGRVLALGRFDSEIEAALAYDRAAITYHGEWAAPNFPELVHG